jgi:hypothetical protein
MKVATASWSCGVTTSGGQLARIATDSKIGTRLFNASYDRPQPHRPRQTRRPKGQACPNAFAINFVGSVRKMTDQWWAGRCRMHGWGAERGAGPPLKTQMRVMPVSITVRTAIPKPAVSSTSTQAEQ